MKQWNKLNRNPYEKAGQVKLHTKLQLVINMTVYCLLVTTVANII